MKILYLSKLKGHEWQGPSHSVPMQIKHQAVMDDVLWVNLCHSENQTWKELDYYYETENGTNAGLQDIPAAFRCPDLVVFQGVYEYPFSKIVYDIWKRNLPYIIVPRSALTQEAQKKKPLKKVLGNIAFFHQFIRKATAVHYLTLSEQVNSARWDTASFVIPNGMSPKETVKTNFESNNRLVFSYIGRIELYQKGLDLLISACAQITKELRDANVSVHLYGPDREGSFDVLMSEIKASNLDDIIHLHDGVFGKEKERVLLDSDAFIMTSRFEGLPMGLIEALAYGLPVMATEGTNLASEIFSADAGWVSDNTAEGIAEMLKAAIRDQKRYQEKSEHALTLSTTYNWSVIAKNTHTQYSQLLNNR